MQRPLSVNQVMCPVDGEQLRTVIPYVGKLKIQLSGYSDKENFLIGDIQAADVILGMPWLHRKDSQILIRQRKVVLQHNGRSLDIHAGLTGDTIPLVSHLQINRSFKNSVHSCLLYLPHDDSKKGDESPLSKIQQSFLEKYASIFLEDLPKKLPPVRPEDQKIDIIPGSSPPNIAPYRLTMPQQEEIRKQVNDLLERGLIQPSSSPYCSPAILTMKKDGSFRMCVDYRALNKITIKNRFPIPRIDDIMDRLEGSTMFSRIDLKSGYHQVRVVPEDVHKTAFRTSFGLYEYLVVPFGLTNAPATFNRMMERIFRKYRHFVGTFFDDILVHSKSLEEHMQHLDLIFKELQAHELYVNAKKSEFFLQEILYLGHIISHGKVRMDPSKLTAIQEWPDLANVHQVRSFLGLCSYYRKFIRHFAAIASPLHELTKKNVPFVWLDKQRKAFQKLKYALTHGPVLGIPNLQKPFIVTADACGLSIGAELSQDGHPIAFESRKLTPAELKFDIYEKELTAVIHALKI